MVLDADAEYLDLALVSITEFDQLGNLGPARAAPARPEIDHQRLALVAFQRYRLVVKVGQRGGKQRCRRRHFLRAGQRRQRRENEGGE